MADETPDEMEAEFERDHAIADEDRSRLAVIAAGSRDLVDVVNAARGMRDDARQGIADLRRSRERDRS